jgi:UDP-N-acetylmuramoylalanine--D-glutamate ligase
VKPGFELEGKRVLVVGLARTGIATALFCAARGARVTASEERGEAELAETVTKLRAAGVALELGGHRQQTFLAQDLIVPSPGVPADHPLLAAARAERVAVFSEIELAWRFLSGRMAAVTGSNGKTTTTALLGHLLETAGIPTLVGGNIGTPLISRVETSSEATVTVAEVSSFQLEIIRDFRPDISLLLNLTPDHLDRHPTLDAYARAKARIFENQRPGDAAIVNADDPNAAEMAPAGPRLFWFSRTRRVAAGVYLRGSEIVFRDDGTETILLRREDIGLRGDHNVENVLAAAAAAFLAGAKPAAIASGVRSFAGVEHRLEFVAEIAGVSYFNDSKATNVDATLKAIDAFPGNLLIILGGKDKGGDFTLLAPSLVARAKLVLLIGAATDKIAGQLAGGVPIERAGTLERALRVARERAAPGDTVLLAPACASFDQFENYEHRGRVFKQVVRQLEREARGEEGGRNHDAA